MLGTVSTITTAIRTNTANAGGAVAPREAAGDEYAGTGHASCGAETGLTSSWSSTPVENIRASTKILQTQTRSWKHKQRVGSKSRESLGSVLACDQVAYA